MDGQQLQKANPMHRGPADPLGESKRITNTEISLPSRGKDRQQNADAARMG
jgi:hypothetical protein